MKDLVKWASGNHVAGNFIMLAILAAGFTTWFKLRKEIFPETAADAVNISVVYPNATPEDVETGVVIPIEEAIADIDGIERISSASAENVGTVTVEVSTGYDTREVMDDIKTRVDAIDNFAEEAERPLLEELVIRQQVLSVAVTADTDEKTLRAIAEEIRNDLLSYSPPAPTTLTGKISRALGNDPSITKVSLAGVRPYELSIEVPEQTLKQYGLTLDSVAQAVRRSSIDLPGGAIKTDSGEVVVRAVGKRYGAEAFGSVVVLTQSDGSVIRLEDIATIRDSFEDIDLSTRFDQHSAVLVDVFRVGSEDTLTIADAVRSYIEQKRKTLPEGVDLEVWNDQSGYLRGRLDLLARNATFGLLLVFIVLALFLRPSLAFLVALGIPASFAGGIWLMPTLGVSINMISLFAFILVLGIVVDDAIVVGENVYSRISSGEHPKVAAWKGTHEVGTIVVFGVLTTMVAFTPMLGLSGVSGKIWPNIPLVVIPTLAFSLIQSKLVLPAHLALLRKAEPNRRYGPIMRVQRAISTGLERFVEKFYTPFIEVCLRARYLVLSTFLTLLLLTFGLVGGGWINTQFFPEVEADILNSQVELPRGAPFESTSKVVQRIEEAAYQLNQKYIDETGRPVLRHVLASAGSQPLKTGFDFDTSSGAANIGEVTIELVPPTERPANAAVLRQEWRDLVGNVPGVSELIFRAQSAGGGNAIDFNVVGANTDQLRRATDYLKEKLESYEGTIEISDSDRTGKRELRFTELTPAGRALGLRLSDVGRQVRQAFFGEEVQRLQRGRDEVKVMVRYPESDRRNLSTLESMEIRTPDGEDVPLLQVTNPDFGRGPDTIQRIDRKRSIKITADVDKSTGANANRIVSAFEKEVLTDLSQKFPGVTWAFEGEQKDQRQSIKEMGRGFLAALVIMFVMMAIPLRSYVQPVIVMSVIPFGIVGAVAGHVIMRTDLSIMSMVGIVALAGVVVNDSLVLVDYVNRHRADGHGVIAAARQAGAKRFRAILLTSLTTFAGLMPMLFETDTQAKFLIPMAISLGFGILFATVITLILVPCVYTVLEDVKKLAGKVVFTDKSGETSRA